MSTKTAPVDYADLISRVHPPAVSAIRNCRPVVASAVELADDGLADSGRLADSKLWVIMHTITPSTVQLFHSRPLRARKLVVRVDSPTGEIVNVLLAVSSTSARGEIYETTADFYR